VVGPGTVTLSNAVAFAGTQSVEIVSNFPQLDELTHDFGTDWQGSVSVYVQGASMCCGPRPACRLRMAARTGLLCSNRPLLPISSHASNRRKSARKRLPVYLFGWVASLRSRCRQQRPDHEVRWLCGAQPTSVTSFQILDLTVWGGTGATAYFDNFSATASPEPATGILITAAMAVLVALRRRWVPPEETGPDGT